MPRAALTLLACALAAACGGAEPIAQAQTPVTPVFDPRSLCQVGALAQPPPQQLGDLQGILDQVRAGLVPQLQGATVVFEAIESNSDFFASFTDLHTIDNPPLGRTYVIRYNARVFDDPPPAEAVAAILVHEFGHVTDYFSKGTDDLVQFAYWYGTASDVSAYERATDERALQAGCASGLKAYRTWLYAHVDAATAVQKQHDYYTPAEIDAWVAAHR